VSTGGDSIRADGKVWSEVLSVSSSSPSSSVAVAAFRPTNLRPLQNIWLGCIFCSSAVAQLGSLAGLAARPLPCFLLVCCLRGLFDCCLIRYRATSTCGFDRVFVESVAQCGDGSLSADDFELPS
jgi:hypothetical protein